MISLVTKKISASLPKPVFSYVSSQVFTSQMVLFENGLSDTNDSDISLF